jgi:cardiolipin synthase
MLPLAQSAAVWPWVVLGALAIAIDAVAAAHAILTKRDVRAALGWAGLIILSPFVGALVYYLFGINRIARRASRELPLRFTERQIHPAHRGGAEDPLPAALPDNLHRLARTVSRMTDSRLLAGNRIEPLENGDEAYPAMLAAIDEAQHAVALGSYIFDWDAAGRQFVDALRRAHERGVAVRVLVDAVGAKYSSPRITTPLQEADVRAAEFLPTLRPWRSVYMNLRNHRKLMIVDGRIGFAGGLNIRECCVLGQRPANPQRDLHFRLAGPVVDQLFRAFAEDWKFATGEELGSGAWTARSEPAGEVHARGIPDGPDEDFETIEWTRLAALGAAQRSVRIITPYFLPDQRLLASLRLAVLRGVDVDIVLPADNNLRFVHWAMMAQIWEVLEPGARVWLSPDPFDHSKLMVIDEAWSLIGSANWDARSLRLNFEYDIECYDGELARRLVELADARIASARRLTLEDVDARPLPRRLRDGLARLLAPYL